jgi:hypothetical protein
LRAFGGKITSVALVDVAKLRVNGGRRAEKS